MKKTSAQINYNLRCSKVHTDELRRMNHGLSTLSTGSIYIITNVTQDKGPINFYINLITQKASSVKPAAPVTFHSLAPCGLQWFMSKSLICWVTCKNKNSLGLLLVTIFIFNEVINLWGDFFWSFGKQKKVIMTYQLKNTTCRNFVTPKVQRVCWALFKK